MAAPERTDRPSPPERPARQAEDFTREQASPIWLYLSAKAAIRQLDDFMKDLEKDPARRHGTLQAALSHSKALTKVLTDMLEADE